MYRIKWLFRTFFCSCVLTNNKRQMCNFQEIRACNWIWRIITHENIWCLRVTWRKFIQFGHHILVWTYSINDLEFCNIDSQICNSSSNSIEFQFRSQTVTFNLEFIILNISSEFTYFRYIVMNRLNKLPRTYLVFIDVDSWMYKYVIHLHEYKDHVDNRVCP